MLTPCTELNEINTMSKISNEWELRCKLTTFELKHGNYSEEFLVKSLCAKLVHNLPIDLLQSLFEVKIGQLKGIVTISVTIKEPSNEPTN